MHFIHVSDLHLHRSQEKNKPVEDRLNVINKKYQDDLLIIPGDITDDGHPIQYTEACDLLCRDVQDTLICPGNHDYGASGNIYSEDRAWRFDDMMQCLNQEGSYLGDNKPAVTVFDGVRFIGLDSNLETDHPFDFACGEIGEAQLKALKGILNGPTMATVVYMHHHPFIRNNPFMELKDAKEFMRAIYGRIDVLLFGHRHVEEIWVEEYAINNIPLIHAAGRLEDSSHALRVEITKDGLQGWEYVEVI